MPLWSSPLIKREVDKSTKVSTQKSYTSQVSNVLTDQRTFAPTISSSYDISPITVIDSPRANVVSKKKTSMSQTPEITTESYSRPELQSSVSPQTTQGAMPSEEDASNGLIMLGLGVAIAGGLYLITKR